MPYVYAHAFCGERTLDLISNDTNSSAERVMRDKLFANQSLFLFGCQGPDPWFYHNSSPFMRNRSYADFGDLLHRQNIDGTFSAMLNSVLADDTDRRFAYFAGYLCHYALDTAAHPYVVHRTQEARFHTPFEAAIDIALLKEKGETLLTMPLKSLLAPIPAAPFAALHIAAAKAMNYPLPEEAAIEPPLHMVKLLPALSDPYGLKLPLYKALERLLGKKDAITNKLFYPNVGAKVMDVLNRAHASWQAPWSEELCIDSFFDIMENAAKKAAEYTTIAYDAVYGDLPLARALEKIGALSFDTGLDYRIDPKMLHFNCAFRS